MANFLPNLEDGENWLPSDIILEIESTTVKLEDGYPQTFCTHVYSYLPVHFLGIVVSPFLMPVIVAYHQRSYIRCLLFNCWGGVHVLPILYHLPGPLYVPVPCYVGNALGGGCFRRTGGPGAFVPSPFIYLRGHGVVIQWAHRVFPILHPNEQVQVEQSYHQFVLLG